MSFNQVNELRLHRLDSDLTKIIKSGEFPFLGLYSDYFYQKIIDEICHTIDSANEPFNLFIKSIRKWPAVFAIFLVQHVTEAYGKRGNHEVYPFISQALRTELTSTQREKLWSHFRRACLELGISVSSRYSGTNYMVDEYLRQAGVPNKYVEMLVEKMASEAEASGVPDDNDPSSIKLWQQGLQNRLTYLPKPVQNAIQQDDEGFYTRLFLKILDCRETVPVDSSEFERLFFESYQKLLSRIKGKLKKRSMAVPLVVWRDNQLGVELPPGDETTWRICCGEQIAQYAGRPESRFVPFEEALPEKAILTDNTGRFSREIPIWQDSKNNRFLIFSNSGQLVTAGQLGQSDPVRLEPGEFTLVLRFVPTDMDDFVEPLSEDPALYSCPITVQPDQEIVLKKGPAHVVLKADSKAAILWEGLNFRGVRGNEFYGSNGLKLNVILPRDFFSNGETEFLVQLKPGLLGQEVEIPLDCTEEGRLQIDLGRHCVCWKPGLTRLLAEVRRKDVRRPLARSAIFLWNGLEEVRNRTRFKYSSSPENLNFEESDNLLFDTARSLITFRNEDYRLFRMVFDLADGKKQSFTSAVPGVFVQLKDYKNDEAMERPVKNGATISASLKSREVVEIFSTTNGELRLGAFRKRVNFDRCGCARLPLAGLVDFLGPESDTLQFIGDETYHCEDLIRIVAPHQVLNFSALYKSASCKATIGTAEEILVLNLKVKDLFTGWEKQLELSCNATEFQDHEGFQAWLTCSPQNHRGVYDHELQFFTEQWPNGAWIITLEANINGRWGRLSNARGDHYAVGMLVVANQLYKGVSTPLNYARELSDQEKFDVLRRTHKRLLECYAPEVWENVQWLGGLWSALVEEFGDKEEFTDQLLELSEAKPWEASGSWIPMYSLQSRVAKLYAQPAKIYRSIRDVRNSLALKSLKMIGELKYGLLPLFQEGRIHQMLIFGFSNAVQIAQGQEPKKFNLKNYEEALKNQDLSDRLRLLRQDEWQPGDGDYLGSLHYLYAWERLTSRYQASLAGNEFRRGKALLLCRNLRGYTPQGFPPHLAAMQPLSLYERPEDPEAEIPVEKEHLLSINRFLFLFAKACRWEVRSPGTVEDFLSKAKAAVGSAEDLEGNLGFLLHVGKDLLCFYLMLLEAILKSDHDRLEGGAYVRKQSARSA